MPIYNRATMPELNVTFAGLALSSPFLAGLNSDNASSHEAGQFVKAGAGALILPPLSEQDLHAADTENEVLPNQATSASVERAEDLRVHFNIRAYLERIESIKSAVDVPVFGSVDIVQRRSLLRAAGRIRQAGADGLEVRLLSMSETNDRSDTLEKRALRATALVRDVVDLPLIVRVQRPVTGPAAFVQALHKAGAEAIIMESVSSPSKTSVEELTLATTDQSNQELYLQTLFTADLVRKTYRRTPANLALVVRMLNLEAAVNAIAAGSTAIVMDTSPDAGNEPARSISATSSEMIKWQRDRGFTSIYDYRGTLSESRLTSTLGLS